MYQRTFTLKPLSAIKRGCVPLLVAYIAALLANFTQIQLGK